jgi:hypothetical protein
MLEDERPLLPVLYTTIRTIGNPLDMVVNRERDDHTNVTPSARVLCVVDNVEPRFLLLLHVPSDVLSFV